MTHAPTPLALDPEACVTASDLVRQFGAWQDRAIRHPVFVMRRGRPSLVLTSIDLMRRLCAGHRSDARSLLDAMEESVLTIDGTGRVRAANRAARACFVAEGADVVGVPLSRLMPEPVATFILERATDLRPGGIEHADIEIRERPFRIILTQSDEGTLLIATDTTDETRCRVLTATHAALSASVEAAGIATARLDRRGDICEANDVLAKMIGADAPALSGTAFARLVAPQYRALIQDAVRHAVADGGTHAIDVEFSPFGGGAVHVALTGIRLRSRIEGIAVAIRPDRLPR